MSCPTKEGVVRRLPSGESDDERRIIEAGQDGSVIRSDKARPVRPPPPSRVMSPCHQMTQSPFHQMSQSPLHQMPQSPLHQMSQSPSYQVSQFPSYQVSQSPSHQVSHLPSHQVSHLPSHQVSHLPSHQVSQSPSHQVSQSPSHQVSQSPAHQVSQSPSHHMFLSKGPEPQKQQQKLQTPLFSCSLGLTPSSTSESLHEQVKEAGKCSPTVAKRVLSLKGSALSSQTENKEPEKSSASCSAAVPPKPAPRLSRGSLKASENVSAEKLDDVQNRQRSNSDVCGSSAKLSSPFKSVDSPLKTEEKRKASAPALGRNKADIAAHFEKDHGKTSQELGSPDVPKRCKPALPQKPDLVKRHSSMRTSNEVEKQFKTEHGGGRKFHSLDNPPYNLTQNAVAQKLEANWSYTTVAANSNASSSNVTKSAVPPKLVVPNIPAKKTDITHQRSVNQDFQMVPETKALNPQEVALHLPPQAETVPPAKPPRTHAHDDYLRVKVVVSQNTESESQNIFLSRKKTSISDTNSNRGEAVEETTAPIIVPRIQQPASISSSVPPPLPPKDGVALCQRPPLRPPPPRRRPNSVDPSVTLSVSSINLFENFKSNQLEPVLPHSHMYLGMKTLNPHTRRASDRLPPPPDFNEFSQKFSHSRSLSSECLHVCRGSTLGSDMSTPPQVVTADQKEAVIDPDGYAVPNAFVRLPGKEFNSTLSEDAGLSPRRILTRNKGSSSETIDYSNRNVQADGVTPVLNQNLTKVNKKTMSMVKQKINQAFANLNIAPKDNTSTDECDWEFVEHGHDTGEFVVEPAVQKKRIEYCASVRRRSAKGLRRSKDFHDAIYPQLFDYCLVVGLRQLVGTDGYEPYVMHKFPENASANLSVPNFCFPDAKIFRPGSATSLSEPYSFVMTYSDGSHVYGYCRRIQPPDASLPEVVCIISPVDAFNMYNTLLNEIETRRHTSFDLASEIIAASFGRPLPKPGKVCHIRMLDAGGDLETIFLNRSLDSQLEKYKLVKVFSSMLMERRIILCSNSLSVLTQTIQALAALLYPFHWQHVYIPLLPAEMLDAVCAPMPFIVGMLSSFLPKVLEMDLEEVLIVDLDKKNIIKSQGDESTILPKRVQKALKTAINMCKIDAEARNAQWLIVVEAFLRMFVETVGHFNGHVRTQQDGNKIFQKEGFIFEIVAKDVRAFLEWFTETQMFEVFIMNHLKELDVGTSDVFLQRLAEFKETRAESARHRGLGAKVKNLGKALKTKFQHS